MEPSVLLNLFLLSNFFAGLAKQKTKKQSLTGSYQGMWKNYWDSNEWHYGPIKVQNIIQSQTNLGGFPHTVQSSPFG